MSYSSLCLLGVWVNQNYKGSIQRCRPEPFWKIDYYDEDLKHWCDPLDPDCNRVLTVMLAKEY